MTRVETGPGWELRLGRWQDVLGDVVECDAVITDPPYLGAAPRGRVSASLVKGRSSRMRQAGDGSVMGYAPLSRGEALTIVERACLIARHRVLIFNDWPGVAAIWPMFGRDGWRSPDHPIVWAKPPGTYLPAGAAVTLPKSCEFAVVGFRKGTDRGSPNIAHYGTAPGHRRAGDMEVVGGKPLDLMRALVRDHTEPGDLVVDFYAGGGTTLLAAVAEGRRAVGAECDPRTFDRAVARLRKGIQAGLPF